MWNFNNLNLDSDLVEYFSYCFLCENKHSNDLFLALKSEFSEFSNIDIFSPFWELFFNLKEWKIYSNISFSFEEYSSLFSPENNIKYEYFLKNMYNYAKSLEYSLLLDREKQFTEDINFLDKVLIKTFDMTILSSFLFFFDEILPVVLGDYFSVIKEKFWSRIYWLKNSLKRNYDLTNLDVTKWLYQDLFKSLWSELKQDILNIRNNNDGDNMAKWIYFLKEAESLLNNKLGFTMSDLISDSRSSRLLRKTETYKIEENITSNFLKNSLDSLDYSMWQQFSYLQKILYLINKKPWESDKYANLFFSYKQNPYVFWSKWKLSMSDSVVKNLSELNSFDQLDSVDVFALVSSFESLLEEKCKEKWKNQNFKEIRNQHTFSSALERKFISWLWSLEIEFEELKENDLRRYKSWTFLSDSANEKAISSLIIHDFSPFVSIYAQSNWIKDYALLLEEKKDSLLVSLTDYRKNNFNISFENNNNLSLLSNELDIYILAVSNLKDKENYEKQFYSSLSDFRVIVPVDNYVNNKEISFRDISAFRDLSDEDVSSMEYPSMITKLQRFFSFENDNFEFSEEFWTEISNVLSCSEFKSLKNKLAKNNLLYAWKKKFLDYYKYVEELEIKLYEKIWKWLLENKDVLDSLVKYTAKQTWIYYKKWTDMSWENSAFTSGSKNIITPMHLTAGKNFQSAWNKLSGRYNGNRTLFSDITRATLEYDSISELNKWIETLINICKEPDVPVVKIRVVSKMWRTFEQAPKDSWYRDIKCILTFANWETGEVQFHLKDVLQAKVAWIPLDNDIYTNIGLRVSDEQEDQIKKEVSDDLILINKIIDDIGDENKWEIKKNIRFPELDGDIISSDSLYHIRRKLYLPDIIGPKGLSYFQFDLIVKFLVKNGITTDTNQNIANILSNYHIKLSNHKLSALLELLENNSLQKISEFLQKKRVDEKIRLLEINIYNNAWKKVMSRSMWESLILYIRSTYKNSSFPFLFSVLAWKWISSIDKKAIDLELKNIEEQWVLDFLEYFLWNFNW